MVRFGLSLPTHLKIDDLVYQAEQARKAGFDYVLMPDHLYSLRRMDMLNKWQTLGVIANRISIGVGTMVANIYREDLGTFVQHVKTLQVIAKKKDIVVGMGRGTNYDSPPHGFVDVDRMECLLKMLPKNVLTIVAARGKGMKQVACSHADGWMVRHALSFDEYVKEKKGVERMCTDDFFLYCADVPIAFRESDVLYKSLAYRYLFQTKYFNSLFSDKDLKALDEDAKAVSRETLRKTIVIGDTKVVIRQLKRYVGNGVGFFSIRLYDDEFDNFKRVIEAINK